MEIATISELLVNVEILDDALIEDLEDLIPLHYKEIANTKLFTELDPDWEFYKAAEKAGILRVFTFRMSSEPHVLVGYWFMIVRNHPHYKTVKVAVDDILFVHQDFRGKRSFDSARECVRKLKAEGVKVITAHCKVAHDLSGFFYGLGFKRHEETFIMGLE